MAATTTTGGWWSRGWTTTGWLNGRRDPGHEGPRFPLDASARPTSWVEREALEVLAQRDPDRPLYLVVSFPHPHDPLDPPAPYDTMYDPASSVVPAEGFEVNDGLPWAFREPLTVQTGPFRPSRPKSERHLRQLQALPPADPPDRRLDRSDPDAVDPGADGHRLHLRPRGLRRPPRDAPQGAVDPLRGPVAGAARRRRPRHGGRPPSGGLVQNLDWVTTALDYAGVPFDPGEFEGRSLRPALVDPGWQPDPSRHVIGGVADGWPTIRRGNLKLITRSHFTLPGRALFDLARGPVEQVDLAADPDRVAEADDLEELLSPVHLGPAAGPARFLPP